MTVTQVRTGRWRPGATSVSQRELYRVLGVDVSRDFSIGEVMTDAQKDDFWTNGEDFLYGLVAMLVLEEVAPGNALHFGMAATPEPSVFSVNEGNIEKALAYRVRVGWRLRGDERQAQREGNQFRLNTLRGSQGIFDPLGARLCSVLAPTGVTPSPPPPPPPGNSRTFTGTLSRQGSNAYCQTSRIRFGQEPVRFEARSPVRRARISGSC